MKKIIIILHLLYAILLSQNNNIIITKIESKLTTNDKYLTINKYLNISKIKINKLDEEFVIPFHNSAQSFKFQNKNKNKKYSYDIYFTTLNNKKELLKIIKSSFSTNNKKKKKPVKFKLPGSSRSKNNTEIKHEVFHFNDLWELEKKHPDKYKKIIELINKSTKKVKSTLKLDPGKKFDKNLTKHISLDNSYYMEYNKNNNFHFYPSSLNENSNRFILNASFSEISFRYKKMKALLGGQNDSEGISIEAGSYENFMNVLPWNSLSFTVGARTLFKFGKSTSLNSQNLIDVKAMYKFKVPWKPFTKLFIFSEAPKLNFVNRVSLDISFTRPFNLPYLNFYIAYGGYNFHKPFKTTIIKNNKSSSYAYFSTIQAKAMMSFYWDSGYDKTFRFKLDLGGAYYDIHKVFYKYNETKIIRSSKQDGWIMPYFAIHLNFVPKRNNVLGAGLNIFDNRAKLTTWVKLYEWDNNNLRLEIQHLTNPLGRKKREWEVDNGTLWQLRFRHNM